MAPSGLGQPHSQLFQAKLQWQNLSQENTTTENIFSCKYKNTKGKFIQKKMPHNMLFSWYLP